MVRAVATAVARTGGDRQTMIILMHSSKTMRAPSSGTKPTGAPVLLDKAEELIDYLRTLSSRQLSKIMTISADLADQDAGAVREVEHRAGPAGGGGRVVRRRHLQWTPDRLVLRGRPAVRRQRTSGSCPACTGSCAPSTASAPTGWRWDTGSRPASTPASTGSGATSIAAQLPASGRIVNLAAGEYSRTVRQARRRRPAGDAEVPHRRPEVRRAEVHRGAREDRARRRSPAGW